MTKAKSKSLNTSQIEKSVNNLDDLDYLEDLPNPPTSSNIVISFGNEKPRPYGRDFTYG